MKKYLIILALLGLCTACESPSTANYRRNVRAWVGRTPQELIAQWGQPTQVLNTENGQDLIYMVEKQIQLPGTNGRYATGPLDYVSPLAGTSAYQTTLFCQTTFVVQNDRIVDWLFEGDACKAD